MTHEEIRAARKSLGLSVADMARMLDTDPMSIRRIEMSPGVATSRNPPPRMIRLLTAYTEGYRPADWPSLQKKQRTI